MQCNMEYGTSTEILAKLPRTVIIRRKNTLFGANHATCFGGSTMEIQNAECILPN